MSMRDKNLIFNSVLKEMQKEAESQHRLMEHHIRQTVNKPIVKFEVASGTEPFLEFKQNIIDEFKMSEDTKQRKKQEEADEAKFEELRKRIRVMTMQEAMKNLVIKELQTTIRRNDIKEFLEKMKETVESFFRRSFSSKKLLLGFELMGLIEDLTLNEEEQEKRKAQRE